MSASLRRMAVGVGMVIAMLVAVNLGLLDTVTGGDCRIKGNISWGGERIYHVPGGKYYDATQIATGKGERWFCTEAEARAAGWRRSRR